MDKQLKTGLSIAIVGIGGYMLWKNWQKLYPSTASASTSTASDTSSSFTGPVPVGKRMKNAVGGLPPKPGRDPLGIGRRKLLGIKRNLCDNSNGDFANSTQNVFASATGQKKNITDIIQSRSSGWVRADGVTPNFFEPMNSGWVK